MMDKEIANAQPLNHHHPINPSLAAESPRKPLSGGGGGGDRLKRDEWSEGAVSSLLEAYESKWVLRNRAKLKGHDWEDVAKHVSSRGGGGGSGKSPKTQTQCKNKIESMKKRYRSESTADASSWPLYSRLDLLLRGNGPPPTPTPVAVAPPQQPPPPPPPPPPPAATSLVPANNNNFSANTSGLLLLPEPPSAVVAPPPETVVSPPFVRTTTAQNSHGSNGVDRVAKEEVAVNKITLSDHASDKNLNSMDITSDSSTPALYTQKAAGKTRPSRSNKARVENMNKKTIKRKRARDHHHQESSGSGEIAESIRWLAEAVVKAEQARMEAVREIERMRVEAEAKRAETDLKRTQIIANTQLEIARLFAAKTVDSSLRIGRN